MREEGDTFDFILAERLARTVAELRASLSWGEYLQWRAFYEARGNLTDLARRTPWQ